MVREAEQAAGFRTAGKLSWPWLITRKGPPAQDGHLTSCRVYAILCAHTVLSLRQSGFSTGNGKHSRSSKLRGT